MAKTNWDFDLKNIDATIRPQDDFYHHANGGWFKNTSIPGDESRWGTFQILRKETELQLKTIVESLQRKSSVVPGSEAQQMRDLYRAAMQIALRNKLHLKPVEPFLQKIAAIDSADAAQKMIAELHSYGIGVFWGIAIDADEKNSDMNILHVYQAGLGLPEREYYLSQKPDQLRVRTAYLAHLERFFSMAGDGPAEARSKAAGVLALETKLAKASMKKEDLRNPDKTYHKLSFSALSKLAPVVDWHAYSATLGFNPPASLNICQPQFIQVVGSLLPRTNLEDLKAYLTWHVLADAAPHLSERFVQASFDFYGTILTGTAHIKPLWRRSLGLVNGALGEALGKLYVAKHFPPAAKKKVDELVSDLFAVYADRITDLDWMSTKTKKRALKKLAMMNRKIGYPKKWRSYKGLVIDPKDHFGNVLRSTRYEIKRSVRKLGKKVDRSEWHMTPQTVNAYYNPTTNDIAFPAAILQPPYFGPQQDAALNYGAIGGVIGHEMTHGFDDEGSKFDDRGNLKMWWRKEDRRRFTRKAEVLKKQFDAYSLHGVSVNGKLTLGENIADLGGYAIALDAYERHLKKTGQATITDPSPLQRFFFGVALDWRQLSRPEVEKMFLLTDPHAPPIFRTNGPASNLPEFYEAFGVKKGDRLYRDPKQRAKIW